MMSRAFSVQKNFAPARADLDIKFKHRAPYIEEGGSYHLLFNQRSEPLLHEGTTYLSWEPGNNGRLRFTHQSGLAFSGIRILPKTFISTEVFDTFSIESDHDGDDRLLVGSQGELRPVAAIDVSMAQLISGLMAYALIQKLGQ